MRRKKSELTFSVVIPTCDRPDYLREAVDSVLDQTLSAHEIIVIDNGNVPVNPDFLPADKRLRIIRALPRFGVSQARNLGAILATGDYISFLDDDDCWHNDYLASVNATAKETNADVILGRLCDLKTSLPIEGKQANFSNGQNLKSLILRRNPGVVGSNTTVKGSCFESSAGYDPSITTNQDKALVLDLLNFGAQPALASGGWVRFRVDVKGPRQTEIKKRIQGKRRFLGKYWHLMSIYDRLFNLAQLFRLWQQQRFGKT